MRIYHEEHKGHEDVELAEEQSLENNSPSGLLPRQLPLASPFRLLERHFSPEKPCRLDRLAFGNFSAPLPRGLDRRLHRAFDSLSPARLMRDLPIASLAGCARRSLCRFAAAKLHSPFRLCPVYLDLSQDLDSALDVAPWPAEFAQFLLFKHLIFMSFMVYFCF